MSLVRRMLISNAGSPAGFYRGQVLDFCDPSGKPTSTLVNLTNGGGKTTLISLFLSVFDTEKNHFIQWLAHNRDPNYSLESYFPRPVGGIFLELELPDQPRLLEDVPTRLVLGQIVTRTRDGKVDRQFMLFTVGDALRFEDLPFSGIPGVESLETPDAVNEWLRVMSRDHAIDGFFKTGNQTQWQNKLHDRGIDIDAMRLLTRYNQEEGGIDKILEFRKPRDFLKTFFSMTHVERGAGDNDNIEVLNKQLEQIKNLPLLKKRQDWLTEAAGRAEDFEQKALKWHTEQVNVTEANQEISALAKGLRKHVERAETAIATLSAEQDRLDEERQEAESSLKQAKDEEHSAEIAFQGRRHQELKQKVDLAEKSFDNAQHQVTLRAGAKIVHAIQRLEAEKRAVDTQLSEIDQQIDLRQKEVNRWGSSYKAVAVEQLKERQKKAEDLAKKKKALEDNKKGIGERKANLNEEQTALTTHKATVDEKIRQVEEERQALIDENLLSVNERPEHAITRLEEEKREVFEKKETVDQIKETVEQDIKENGKNQLEATEKVATARGKCEQLEKDLQRLNQHRVEFFAIKELPGLSVELMQSQAIEERLPAYREIHKEKSERKQAAEVERDACRAVVESEGVLPPGQHVQDVLTALHQAGLKSAASFPEYLNEVTRHSQEQIEACVASNPLRFFGIKLNNEDDLQRAKAILTETGDRLEISAPVHLSLISNEPDTLPAGKGFTQLPPTYFYSEDASAQRRAKAQRRLEALEDELEALTKGLARLDQAILLLSGYQTDGGTQEMNHLQDAKRAADNDLITAQKAIEDLESKAEELTTQKSSAERDARRADSAYNKVRDQYDRVTKFNTKRWSQRAGWGDESAKADQRLLDIQEELKQLETSLEALSRRITQTNEEISGAQGEVGQMQKTINEIDCQPHEGALEKDSITALAEQYEAARQRLMAEAQRPDADHLKKESEGLHNKIKAKHEEFNETSQTSSMTFEEAAQVLDTVGEEQLSVEASKWRKRLDSERTSHVDARFRFEQADKDWQALCKRVPDAKDFEIPDTSSDILEVRRDKARQKCTTAEDEFDQVTRECENHGQRLKRRRLECREDQERLETLTADYGVDETVPALVFDRTDFFRERTTRVTRLRRGNEAVDKALGEAKRALTLFRRLLEDPAFRDLEPVLCERLLSQEDEGLLRHPQRLKSLIKERQGTIAHELEQFQAQKTNSLRILADLAIEGVQRLHRARRIKLPDSLAGFGGKSVMKVERAPKISRDELVVRLEPLLERCAETYSEEGRSGFDKEYLLMMEATLYGLLAQDSGDLGIKLIHLDKAQVGEYRNPVYIGGSGGEKLTSALLLFLVLVNLRKPARHSGPSQMGNTYMPVPMDNPIGKVSKPELLRPQIQLAEALGVQLLYLTGINDLNVKREMTHLVTLKVKDYQTIGGKRYDLIENVSHDVDRSVQAINQREVGHVVASD